MPGRSGYPDECERCCLLERKIRALELDARTSADAEWELRLKITRLKQENEALAREVSRTAALEPKAKAPDGWVQRECGCSTHDGCPLHGKKTASPDQRHESDEQWIERMQRIGAAPGFLHLRCPKPGTCLIEQRGGESCRNWPEPPAAMAYTPDADEPIAAPQPTEHAEHTHRCGQCGRGYSPARGEGPCTRRPCDGGIFTRVP